MIVDGIELDITAEALDDFDVVECLAVMMDEESSDKERMIAIPKLFRLVFGPDWQRIKNELRAQHEGKLTNATVMGFFNSLTEALNAKNS